MVLAVDAVESATLYAATHRGTEGDLDFYHGLCEGSESILELGCGDGRVLEALLDRAALLVGIEWDEGLIGLARERFAALPSQRSGAPRLLRADMRDFALAKRFDRILLPHSGIYCLLTPADCIACLDRAAAHLAEDGLLIFDAYPADSFHREIVDSGTDDADVFEPVLEIEAEGRLWEVLERNEWDADRQRIDATYRYVPHEANTPTADITIRHRYWLGEQVAPLLERANLKLRGLYGDFEGTPFDDGAEALVVIASR